MVGFRIRSKPSLKAATTSRKAPSISASSSSYRTYTETPPWVTKKPRNRALQGAQLKGVPDAHSDSHLREGSAPRTHTPSIPLLWRSVKLSFSGVSLVSQNPHHRVRSILEVCAPSAFLRGDSRRWRGFEQRRAVEGTLSFEPLLGNSARKTIDLLFRGLTLHKSE